MPLSPHHQAIVDAKSTEEFLTGLAVAFWTDNGGEGECPEHLIPTKRDLAAWLGFDGKSDPRANLEAQKKSEELLHKVLPDSFWSEQTDIGLAACQCDDERGVTLTTGLADLHGNWKSMEMRPKHPLGPLVRDWQDAQAVPVQREERKDAGILPVISGGLPTQERQRGQAMTGAVGPATGNLALLEGPADIQVPLLELVDASGIPIRSKGRGAPLPMRILVNAILAVRPGDRERGPVEIAMTVKEFKEAFFPKHYRPERHWPRIVAALREVHGATIPMEDGWRWRILSLITEPPDSYKEAHLDRELVFSLLLPRGSKTGPKIPLPLLDEMGRTSGPKYRAYLAAQSLNWIKGRRVPQNKRRGVWSWSRNPEHYPVIDRKARRRLSFGIDDMRNRGHREQDEVWENLPDLEVLKDQRDAKTGARGWRFIPPRRGKGGVC